jgi:hypothetical protein
MGASIPCWPANEELILLKENPKENLGKNLRLNRAQKQASLLTTHTSEPLCLSEVDCQAHKLHIILVLSSSPLNPF